MSIPKTVADVIQEHIVLEVESIDRMYLNVYQGRLQRGGGVSDFFRRHRGEAFATAHVMARMTRTFLAAIELVEKLTNKRAWDDDGSTMRDFVIREIQREKGIHAPLHGRRGPPFAVPEHLNGPSGFETPEEAEPGGAADRRNQREAQS